MTPKYEIILRWSGEDDAWIAEAPDLPGCMAHGDSPEEALAQIQDAMRGWLEVARETGRPIPAPRERPTGALWVDS